MASLRLLAVLSVVALLHSATLAEDVKCLHWGWTRDGNGEIIEYSDRRRKEVPCSSGLCYWTSVHYEQRGRFIQFDAGCVSVARAPLTAPYECKPASLSGIGQNLHKRIACYCKAGTDSVCNQPELMFNPTGDDGQKSRALDLRQMGIIAEWQRDTEGQRVLDFQYFTCETWGMEFGPTGDIVKTGKTSDPCQGTCGMNINLMDAEKGVGVYSQCWSFIHDQTCTPGPDGKYMACYCAGSDCNSAERLFDPAGDAGQKSRALMLRTIGVIAEVKTTGFRREIAFKFDDDFGKTTIKPVTVAPPARTTAARAPEVATTVPDGPSGVAGDDTSISPEEAADDACDPDDFYDEDAATGLSLALAVVLTILRLI